MTETATGQPRFPIPRPIVVVRGSTGLGIGEHAAERVTEALRHAHGPVHRVRIALNRLPDPALSEPVWASCHVDVNGGGVHVHAYADTARTAVDRLVQRLTRQLDDRYRGRRSHHPHQVDLLATPEGAVESHPSYGTPRCTVAEAVADLIALDYRFHLFTHESGVDFLLRDTGDGYEITATEANPGLSGPRLVTRGTPRLTIEEALARTAVSGESPLFYIDPADGRGRVLYRRADGGHGLITPNP